MLRRELMFAASSDPGQVFDVLAARFLVRAASATTRRWTCLDTADWRLHRAGMTLRDARHGRSAELVLQIRDAERVAASSRVRSWPRRLADVPPSIVRDRIAPTVGVRALLPLADVGIRSVPLQLLDDVGKTRVRVRVDQQRLIGTTRAAVPLRVLIAPLRGYERDGQRCVEMLTDALAATSGSTDAATAAMTAAGHRPGEAAASMPDLDPRAPAPESLARVLRTWARIMAAARPGVLTDIDPEYLHDLRTAVRATRSLLKLSDSVLTASDVTRLAEEFAWLGRLTSPLRDIDVQQLELNGRGAVDLAGLEEHLEPLRRHVAERRRLALRHLRGQLQSPRGESLLGSWDAVLDRIASPDVVGPTTSSVASAQIVAAYRKIRRAAPLITGETVADDLHDLRKRCKRMRYVLDAYESVCAPEPHRAVSGALKKLQSCLGDIQDSVVHRDTLAVAAASLQRRQVPVDTMLAVGALRERIAQRDVVARKGLDERLRSFCAPAMAAQIKALVEESV